MVEEAGLLIGVCALIFFFFFFFFSAPVLDSPEFSVQRNVGRDRAQSSHVQACRGRVGGGQALA